MGRRLALLVAGLCSALLIAVLWPRRPSEGAAAPALRSASDPSAGERLLAPGPGPAAPDAAPVAVPAGDPRRAVDEPARADGEPACRVRVVHASSGAPAPEARVWIEEEGADRALWLEAMQRFNDVEPVLQAGFGRELALDARGEARVPRPSRALSVAAALGDLHGEAQISPDDELCRVELTAYHALAVLVVDRDGRPLEDADVMLCWGEHDPWQSQMEFGTDEHGIARVPKLEGQLWPRDYRGPLRVTLPVLPCEPEHVSFTLDDVPEEPVRLVAGDSGRLVVQLTDVAGVELPEEGYASFEVAADSAADLPAHLLLNDGVWTRIRAGRAVFEHVGLDLALELYAGAAGREGSWREVRGPRAAGEEVVVKVPVGSRHVTARGRVRGITADAEAAGPRGARLSGAAGSASFDVWIEEDGPFESRILPQRPAALDELAVPWTLQLSGVGGPARILVATPRADAQEGALDFGELDFPAPTALVHLRVLGRGRGVEGARVEVGRSATRTVWCDGEGRCALDGAGLSLPTAVRAVHRDWLPSDWLELGRPEGEGVLELRAGAALEGQLLVWEGGDPLDFELALRREQAPEGEEPERAHLLDGGFFRFAPCEPGRATLALSYGAVLVHEQPGIELRAGETTDLGALDLRAALQPMELAFALADGEPLQDGALVVREPGGGFSLWLPIGETGRVRFLSRGPRIDLWAVGRGAGATLFEGVVDGQRLVLGAAASARLRLPSGCAPPAGPLALTVRGERVSPEAVEWEPLDHWSAEGTAGPDGIALLQAPCPGTYRLSWFVVRADTGSEVALEEAERQVVVVPEPPEEALFEASLPAEAVERAVRAAGG